MKLSVSMPKDDVEFIDAYAAEHGIESRSAVLHRAIRLLRTSQLGDQYAAAWAEWSEGDGPLWDAVTADGID